MKKDSSAGTTVDSSTNTDVSSVSQPIAKHNVVGSASRPKSVYEIFWNDFIKTNDYKGCVEAMQQKGMAQPYIDNILRYAFDAGYRCPKV